MYLELHSNAHVFYADAVLFDMDGTLTDSISAVEAAWSKVAKDLGEVPEYVVAATHGKRAIDNLRQFRPNLARANTEEMNGEVRRFEESILFFADAYNKHGPGSRSNSFSTANVIAQPISSATTPDSSTPALTPTSAPSSRASSMSVSNEKPSFVAQLRSMLSRNRISVVGTEDSAINDDQDDIEEICRYKLEAWQIEARATDRSVKILPGVKKMIESIPEGSDAVATSGAKIYAYGYMSRVGITPPVTITADDKRLKAGKPAPDSFLLAAKCLGFETERCVRPFNIPTFNLIVLSVVAWFSKTPSGIRAGVASGATVIAMCTSHERAKIEGCGAHYIVENMENVDCGFDEGEGRDSLSGFRASFRSLFLPSLKKNLVPQT
ncbi:hypothetical protein L218DRAFT_973364 [Marasmius fiardii PR-910]|nr:hypothetical protein L218DRAFT_973364 [Marasmius fiardii PR-910]